ncbi:alpha/beta-hydrolase [Peniophora sp. CONT]|nr:alpha/beta-hydrolase [Peniophora sp. CONT]
MGFYDQVVLPGTALLGTFFSSSSTVDLGYATYAAANTSLTPGVTSFLGIRYAAPPTGELRFSAPRAPDTVTGVQQSVMPPPCWDSPVYGGAVESPYYNAGGKAVNVSTLYPFSAEEDASEDCLFVNVHVPDSLNLAGNASVPVLVWIHGGGYVGGSNRMYPTENLARNADGELIVVSVQYRVGPFGFLAGRDVKEGGALNAGLLDQEFALKWVQQYISKFGGDPSRVAIYGESAGAGSVLQHVVAHAGNTQPPLFRAALLSSTFLPTQHAWDDPFPESLYQTIASQVNCTGEDVLKCLRAVDPRSLALAGAHTTFAAFVGTFPLAPVVDGDLIVERPHETLAKRTVNGDVAFVISNTNEGTMFTPEAAVMPLGLKKYIGGLFPTLEQEDVERAFTLYGGPDADVASATSRVMGEAIFTCPGYAILDAFTEVGKPAWKGSFDVPPAGHGNDLIYIFDGKILGLLEQSIPPTDVELGHAMRSALIGAATSLDPNTVAAVPEWARYDEGSHMEMTFNRTEDGMGTYMETFTTDKALLERCEFWRNVADKTPQ